MIADFPAIQLYPPKKGAACMVHDCYKFMNSSQRVFKHGHGRPLSGMYCTVKCTSIYLLEAVDFYLATQLLFFRGRRVFFLEFKF